MKISAVIPTLNRHQDLILAVDSVKNQIRKPDELIIIDQSDMNYLTDLFCKFSYDHESLNIVYVHDLKIRGLVDAKASSLMLATGEIICFLEDDVVLEPNYFLEIERGFLHCNTMLGCSGIITNPPPISPLKLFLFHIFHRGIYKDNRVDIFGNFDGVGHQLIPSRMISGGLSAWRSVVFNFVRFDKDSGFHMMEDIDFSTRVYEHFQGNLYINPNARLAHYSSPLGRDSIATAKRRKTNEIIIYFKKRNHLRWSFLSCCWLLFGMLIFSISASIHMKSFNPVLSFFRGLNDGVFRSVEINN